MSRVFDPNTNPYADDLWRLALAPPSRFSPRERKTMGHILAGKLYGLVTWRQGRLTYNLANVQFRGKRMREVVALVLLFDDELDYRTLESTAEAVARSNRADMVIVLNAGATGVVEIYYGSWGDAAFRSILEMPKHIRSLEDSARYETQRPLPHPGDAELRRAYLGHDRGGGGRGDGGGNDGVPPGGEGGSSGAGGVGELLNHPLLFSIERDHFDAILRQV